MTSKHASDAISKHAFDGSINIVDLRAIGEEVVVRQPSAADALPVCARVLPLPLPPLLPLPLPACARTRTCAQVRA